MDVEMLPNFKMHNNGDGKKQTQNKTKHTGLLMVNVNVKN